MKPSDIDIDAFNTAHSLARQSISEHRWENEFTEKLTQFLVAELARVRIESVMADLEHTMAFRMTFSDMPESVKRSGLFKLELENATEDQKNTTSSR